MTLSRVRARPTYKAGRPSLPLGFHHPLPLVTHSAFCHSNGGGVASPTSRPLPLRPPLPEGCFALFHLAELWRFLRFLLWQDVFSQHHMAMAPAGLDSGLSYLGSEDYFRREMVFL